MEFSDVDAVDQFRRTPLHYAASLHDRQAVLYLLSQGAKLDAIDQDGYNPLMLAVSPHVLSLDSTSTAPMYRTLKVATCLSFIEALLGAAAEDAKGIAASYGKISPQRDTAANDHRDGPAPMELDEEKGKDEQSNNGAVPNPNVADAADGNDDSQHPESIYHVDQHEDRTLLDRIMDQQETQLGRTPILIAFDVLFAGASLAQPSSASSNCADEPLFWVRSVLSLLVRYRQLTSAYRRYRDKDDFRGRETNQADDDLQPFPCDRDGDGRSLGDRIFQLLHTDYAQLYDDSDEHDPFSFFLDDPNLQPGLQCATGHYNFLILPQMLGGSVDIQCTRCTRLILDDLRDQACCVHTDPHCLDAIISALGYMTPTHSNRAGGTDATALAVMDTLLAGGLHVPWSHPSLSLAMMRHIIENPEVGARFYLQDTIDPCCSIVFDSSHIEPSCVLDWFDVHRFEGALDEKKEQVPMMLGLLHTVLKIWPPPPLRSNPPSMAWCGLYRTLRFLFQRLARPGTTQI